MSAKGCRLKRTTIGAVATKRALNTLVSKKSRKITPGFYKQCSAYLV